MTCSCDYTSVMLSRCGILFEFFSCEYSEQRRNGRTTSVSPTGRILPVMYSNSAGTNARGESQAPPHIGIPSTAQHWNPQAPPHEPRRSLQGYETPKMERPVLIRCDVRVPTCTSEQLESRRRVGATDRRTTRRSDGPAGTRGSDRSVPRSEPQDRPAA